MAALSGEEMLLNSLREYIARTMEAEGQMEVFYGTWSDGGADFSGLENAVAAGDIVLPKLLTEEQEVELEEEDGSRRTVKFLNALKPGDRIAAVRSRDGQKFVIIDRF